MKPKGTPASLPAILLGLLGLALLLWPLYLFLFIRQNQTGGEGIATKSIATEATPTTPAFGLDLSAQQVADQPTLAPPTPLPSPPPGIPDIPGAYCVPLNWPIYAGVVTGVTGANNLTIETEDEIAMLAYLGTGNVSQSNEPIAYQNALAFSQALTGEELVIVQPTAGSHAYLFLGQRFLNLELVSEGLLENDAASEHPCAGLFTSAERGAFLAGTGIWADEPHPPRNYTPLAPFFTVEVQFWADEIIAWSEAFGLDANLIATIMQIESCGNPYAVSDVGAMGLFQVMPQHFEENDDPYAPETNARRGLYLFQDDLIRFGNITQAFAAYNTGYFRAGQPALTWPTETKSYVYWGESIYGDALNGAPVSVVLHEWLENGGWRGCQQAAKALNITGTIFP